MYDTDLCGASRHGVIVSAKGYRIGGFRLPVHLYDFILGASVHVHCTFMDLPESLHLIHLCNDPGILPVHQFISDLIYISKTIVTCRKCISGPGKSAILGMQLFYPQKNRYRLTQIGKNSDIIKSKGQFRRRCPDMGKFNEKIVSVHHCALALPVKKPVRIDGDILVKRQVVQDQIVGTGSAASSGSSCLLPEGSSCSRKSGEHGCVYFTDVYAQLKSIGGNKAAKLPGRHFPFNLFPFSWGIASPVA